MRCLSCRHKNSIERCEHDVLKNCMFCSVHMRVKHVRLWSDYNPDVRTNIIKIQSYWRRYMVQRILKLAGKGVLQRTQCHNEDEIVTGESKITIHPFDYFSIEEDGKIWWFDQKSMIDWSEKNVQITNPFTRTRLSPSDCRRLRKLRMNRIRKNMSISHSEIINRPIEEQLNIRWLRIVQIVNECGMDNTFEPIDCIRMTYRETATFMGDLIEHLKTWMYTPHGDPITDKSRRWKYYSMLRAMRNVMHTYGDSTEMNNDITGLILGCLNDMSDPTEFVFFILSALVNSEVLAADL